MPITRTHLNTLVRRETLIFPEKKLNFDADVVNTTSRKSEVFFRRNSGVAVEWRVLS